MARNRSSYKKSEEEEKENESVTSDVEGPPSETSLVESVQSINNSATQTSWSEDGLFKVPQDRAAKETQESIGQRTRSKLCLSDTPLEMIERAFVPPDITTDMYDSECDDEDWKNFLKDFTNPLNTNDQQDDEEADPEYNVWADEEVHDQVDHEELRVDRAVKVSRKELNNLMAELFDYTDMLSSDEEEPRNKKVKEATGQHLHLSQLEEHDLQDVTVASSTHELCNSAQLPEELLTYNQRLLLGQQMRQHVQLLTQHFLQCCGHPYLSDNAAICKDLLNNQMGLAKDKNSTFHTCNLEEALQLVSVWEKVMADGSSVAESIKDFIRTEVNTDYRRRKQRSHRYESLFPLAMMEIVVHSKVFIYPHLLPSRPFRIDYQEKMDYLPSEDQLVAIGLEQFLPYVLQKQFQENRTKKNNRGCYETVKLIVQYLLPCKIPENLYTHTSRWRHLPSSPIKYYFTHGQAPVTTHYLLPFSAETVRAPIQQPDSVLPDIWREYITCVHYTSRYFANNL